MPEAAHAITLDEAKAQLETLGSELASLEDELSERSGDLEETKAAIEACEANISATRAELSDAQGQLAQSTRSTYKLGKLGLLDIIMESRSFEDLVSRIYYADAIADAQANAIQRVRSAEQELVSQQTDLVNTRNEQETTLAEVQERVDDHEQKVAEAKRVYEQLDAEAKAALAAEAQARAQVNANGTNVNALSNAVSAATSPTPNASQGSSPSTPSAPSETPAPSNPEPQPEPERPSYDYSSGDPISIAMQFVGNVPYVYGGNSPQQGFDCSGMVCYVFNQLGLSLPRTTYGQISYLKSKGSWKTDLSELNPGDIVFPHSGHVGIYAGDGMFIDAPKPGMTVQYRALYGFMGGGSVW